MSLTTASLAEIAEVAAGGGAPQNADAFTAEGTPFIRAGSLNPLVNGASESTLEHLTEEVAKEHGLRKFPRDTVVFAKSGMSATKGHIYRLRNEAYVVNHLAAIVPTQRVVPEFLEQSLRVFSPVRLIQDAAYPSVRLSDVAKMRIPLPPLAEQRRIAEVLDRAQTLRAKRRAALGQLDYLTQYLFIDLFGDPVSNPKGVKVVRLADVATRITDGVHQKPNYTDAGVPFISVKDITTGKLIFDQCKFISIEDHEKFTKRCKPERLDILYTKVGATYGRPAIVETDREFSLYVSVCIIKPRKDIIDPHFLNAALGTSAVKNQADRRIKGIGVPDLHLDQIQNFLIPLPSMNQQREFARRATEVEALKTSQRASLAELNALFATLQFRAFRGEL